MAGALKGLPDECVVKLEPQDPQAAEAKFYVDTVPVGMSKTQWKKKLKLQEKRRKWEQQKKEAKQRRRERQKEKRKEQKALGLPLPKKTKVDNEATPKTKGGVADKGQFKKMSDECASSVRVAVDCSFEDKMPTKAHQKLIKQLQRCYACNRRSVSPFQYYVTSFGGTLKAELDYKYPVSKEYELWDVHYRTEDFVEVFGKENVVYLLAESPNVLTELDPTKAYIIGGLVDHNHQKGLCHKLALDKGLAHASLPLSEYIKLNCRKVLTINHVFEILLAFSTNGGDWKKAFYQVIPPRKLVPVTGNEASSAQCKADSEGQQSDSELAATTSSTVSSSVKANHGLEEIKRTTSLPSSSQTDSRVVSDHVSNESSNDSNVSGDSGDGLSSSDERFEDDIHSQLEPCFPDFD